MSAAARETAIAAVVSSALGAGDLNGCPVVGERQQVRRLDAREERPLQGGRAQLVGVGEAVADGERPGAVAEVEQVLDEVARQGAVDLARAPRGPRGSRPASFGSTVRAAALRCRRPGRRTSRGSVR